MSKEKDAEVEAIEGEATNAENETPETETEPTATPHPESLIDKIKTLIDQGADQRLIVANKHGQSFIEVPLVFGLVGAGLAALLLPWLTLILVAVGLLTKMSLNLVSTHQ